MLFLKLFKIFWKINFKYRNISSNRHVMTNKSYIIFGLFEKKKKHWISRKFCIYQSARQIFSIFRRAVWLRYVIDSVFPCVGRTCTFARCYSRQRTSITFLTYLLELFLCSRAQLFQTDQILAVLLDFLGKKLFIFFAKSNINNNILLENMIEL